MKKLGMWISLVVLGVSCGSPPVPSGMDESITRTNSALFTAFTNTGPAFDVGNPFYGMQYLRYGEQSESSWTYFNGISTVNPVPNCTTPGTCEPPGSDETISLHCNTPPCTNTQNVPWTLTVVSAGNHGFQCTATNMYYYIGNWPQPPPAANNGSVGSYHNGQLLYTFAGNQGYWFNAAPVNCTSWKKVTLCSPPGRNCVSQWQRFTSVFQSASLYVFEMAVDANFASANPNLVLWLNPVNLTTAAPYFSQWHAYYVQD